MPKLQWRGAAARRIREVSGAEDIEAGIAIVVARLLDGISCPPTDLDAVFPKLNVFGCYEDEQLAVPGELRKVNGALTISLYPGLAKSRRRFTIAHELGHAFFETTGKRPPRDGAEVEKLCNKFAAEILMPTDIFREKAGGNPDVDRLLGLSLEFATSQSATFLRAAELYGMRSFCIENGEILWVAGMSRKTIDHGRGIQEGIRKAMKGEAGRQSIELHAGASYRQFDMQWRFLARRRQAVFLLAA